MAALLYFFQISLLAASGILVCPLLHYPFTMEDLVASLVENFIIAGSEVPEVWVEDSDGARGSA